MMAFDEIFTSLKPNRILSATQKCALINQKHQIPLYSFPTSTAMTKIREKAQRKREKYAHVIEHYVNFSSFY